MAEDSAVELRSVTKRFNDTVAVRDVSLRIPRGSTFGLIGPNGSGKTTALRLILGLYHPDRGELSVLGRPPSRRVSERIGYLPEERGLYRKMTLRDVLTYYARLKGIRADAKRLTGWLERLGIAEYAGTRVEALSKGTAQKAQLVAAVLGDPELLVLDEPLSGLDPVSSERVREAILAMHRRGTTILLSTHDMTLAERMCDRVAMLHHGRIVLDGTRSQIDARYGQPTVKVSATGDFADLPGVRHTLDFGRYRELVLEPGTDPQALVAELLARATVHRFEVSRPSLHDLFLRLAGETSVDER